MVAEVERREKRGLFGLAPVALALLVAIVVLGAVVRFWNLNWDQGTYDLHPDERTLNEMVRRLGPDLNPHFYYYGTFPIYLYKITGEALSAATGDDWLAQVRILLIGRFYSALASVATLVVLFAIGRRLWGVSLGLFSAALMASAGLAIQAAHFSTVESLLTLELALILWTSLRILDGGGRRWYIFAGVVLGLALGTKLTSASFIVMPLLGHFLQGRRSKVEVDSPSLETAGREAPRSKARLLNEKWDLLFFVGATAVATLAAEPYYILGWDEFWRAVQVQSDELSGALRFSYVWQFIGSTPYVFELKNLVVWGLGLPFGILALLGWWRAIWEFVFWVLNWVRGRRKRLAKHESSSEVVDGEIKVPTANPKSKIQSPKSLAFTAKRKSGRSSTCSAQLWKF